MPEPAPRSSPRTDVARATPELRRLAARVLEDSDAVTEAITDRLLQQEPSYREGEARVPEADLRHTVRGDVEAVLRHLAFDAGMDAELAAQREIGQRRAEQGLPLESLLRAYQLGGQLTWQRIVDEGLGDPEADIADLLRGASYLWEVVDRLCTEVGAAYRVAVAALSRHKAERREVLFDALLDGRAADVTLAREAALALFLPTEGPYVVVVSDAPLTLGSEPELALRTRGLASCWRLRGQRHIGIVALEHGSAAQVADILAAGVPGRAGISPHGRYLGTVRELVRLAELAMRTVTPGRSGVAIFEDSLIAALAAAAPDVAGRLTQQVLEPLSTLEPANRELLLETLSTYIEHDGSVALAAERLYCHRNTVLNRLRRFEGLTGLSLARPADLAKLTIILEAVRLDPPDAAG